VRDVVLARGKGKIPQNSESQRSLQKEICDGSDDSTSSLQVHDYLSDAIVIEPAICFDAPQHHEQPATPLIHLDAVDPMPESMRQSDAIVITTNQNMVTMIQGKKPGPTPFTSEAQINTPGRDSPWC
jgi:hypothetical protein